MRIFGYRRAGLALCALCLALAGCAGTPPIADENGNTLPGSIAALEKVEIAGSEQWLLMRGYDEEAPVLLWLAGGPGGSEIGRTRDYLGNLEKSFVFVNWEQPGTGKSYGALDMRRADYTEFVDHTIAVSEYLCERFGKERIYLAGHSWGSIIGLMAAERRPDLYAAYIGLAQQVEFVENDRTGYEMVLERAAAAGDDGTVEKLEDNGPPPYSAAEKGKYAYLFQRIFRYSPEAPDAPRINEMSIFNPEEYTLIDTVNLIRGVIQGVNHVYPQLVGLDFRRDIPALEIPVFFVTGRYDYTCLSELSYDYYSKLEAPVKRHYWFERSGHEACFQEPRKFEQLLLDEVVPLSREWRNETSEGGTPPR